MAGDWIKFELATLDKPEVIAMSEMLGTSTFDTVGRLLKVWGWFDQQTRNGNALGVTGSALKRFIDRLAESQGFAASMEKVGWLNDEGVPNFTRHNGKPAKERALTNDRVKRSRNAESNADTVTKSLLEKRREEKKQLQARPSACAVGVEGMVADGVDAQTAADFLQARRVKRAPLTARAWEGIKVEAKRAGWPIEAAVRKALARGWVSFEAKWVDGEAPGGSASHKPAWEGAH